MTFNTLNDNEEKVIINKETEAPFTGEYDEFYSEGTFICRRCNSPLFSSQTKFDAGCGWPAFDDNFPDAVKRIADSDGNRIEITCSNCGGHLGHVFTGEKFTSTDTRHCVNSVSIKFVSKKDNLPKILRG